jgi:microcystin degradation protein MlrC
VSFRLLIAGISHETNTYCRGTTPADAFWALRGARLIERLRGTGTDVGGMLQAAEELGAEVMPSLYTGAMPSGVIEAGAYSSFKQEILRDIREAGELDAVALALHGAGVVEGIDDLEGDLAGAVRDLVGPDVKLVATFDLHGNVTQAMADRLDLMFGCHEYPHTDMDQRGHEAVARIPDLLSGAIRPVTCVEPLPVLLPTSTTLLGAAKEFKEHCLAVERWPGVIDCTFFHGFPYTDVPCTGSSVTVTADGRPELARATAQETAQRLWNRREKFRVDSLSCEEAIERALAVGDGPVVINETSDNPGGGAPGDGTHLLRAMLEARLENACFGFICDPEVAAAAHAAGVGATLEAELGGKTDALHGPPLPIRATVKTLSDGRFRWRAMARGVRANLGRSARLQLGGIDVVVASRRNQTLDPQLFIAHGIDVLGCRIVALKSSNHFRAGFQSLARAIVTADPPGLTTLRVEVFPHRRNPRPLWPIDAEARYEPPR